jgi:sortase A
VRRIARLTGTLLIVAGVATLAWAFTVWKWEDPFTATLNYLDQRQLAQSFDRRLEEGRPPGTPASVDTAGAIRREAVTWSHDLRRGDAVARLRIPRLGLKTIVVNGTDHASLKRGPGRYLGSALPGQGKLIYIAGHRTTYGAPFSGIEKLRKGDSVFLQMPYGTFEYRITGHRIVAASDTSVLQSKGHEQLALQACHPRFFATQRYIAYARPAGVLAELEEAHTPAG